MTRQAMRITGNEVMELDQALEDLGRRGDLDKYFSYAVMRSRDGLKAAKAALLSVVRQPKEFQEFDRLRVDLAHKYAKKDAAGKPVIHPPGHPQAGQVDIEDLGAFKAELDPVKEKYKDVIAEVQQSYANFNQVLLDEIDVLIHQTDFDAFPAKISPELLSKLEPLIRDRGSDLPLDTFVDTLIRKKLVHSDNKSALVKELRSVVGDLNPKVLGFPATVE